MYRVRNAMTRRRATARSIRPPLSHSERPVAGFRRKSHPPNGMQARITRRPTRSEGQVGRFIDIDMQDSSRCLTSSAGRVTDRSHCRNSTIRRECSRLRPLHSRVHWRCNMRPRLRSSLRRNNCRLHSIRFQHSSCRNRLHSRSSSSNRRSRRTPPTLSATLPTADRRQTRWPARQGQSQPGNSEKTFFSPMKILGVR